MPAITENKIRAKLLHPELKDFVFDKVDARKTKRESEAHRPGPDLPREQSYSQTEEENVKFEAFFDPRVAGPLSKRIRSKMTDFEDFPVQVQYLDRDGNVITDATEDHAHCGILECSPPAGDANGTKPVKLELMVAMGDLQQ